MFLLREPFEMLLTPEGQGDNAPLVFQQIKTKGQSWVGVWIKNFSCLVRGALSECWEAI